MVKRGGSARTVQRLVRGCWLHCSERGRLLRCPGRGGGHREEVWRRRSAVLVRPAARRDSVTEEGKDAAANGPDYNVLMLQRRAEGERVSHRRVEGRNQT